MCERYVLLGLARPRADWFRRVGQWATSAVVAVLVMAFLGVAMWAAFNFIFDETQGTVHEQVREIGSD
jgi:hypothetical protein